jgi:hypothetical protein
MNYACRVNGVQNFASGDAKFCNLILGLAAFHEPP